MNTKRWIGTAATAAMLALPLLAQEAPEAKDAKRRAVIVRNEQIEVLGDRDGHRFVFAGGGGYLGISPVGLTDELRAHFGVAKDAGVMVGKVFEDTPAAKAGLRVGDVVTQVDGKDVESTWDITRALQQKKKGDQVRVDFFRDRAPQNVFVTLDERRGDFAFRMPEFPRIEIDREKLEKALEGARAMAPKARARVFTFGTDCDELQARIRDLESRLKELEKRLK